MRDIAFSCLMVGTAVVTVSLYLARVLVRGRARSARADQDGGSAVMGKSIVEYAYWLAGPVVGLLARAGVSPNGVTLFSLIPGIGAGVALGFGWLGLGCTLATAASLSDLVDGLLARRLGISSDAGEVLDALVDRTTELAFFGGLLVHYRDSLPALLVTFAALAGSLLVSYTTAKAESLQVPPPRGWMRRAERAVYLSTGAGLTPLFAAAIGSSRPWWARELLLFAALAFVGVVAIASSARRTRAVMRALAARSRPAPVALADSAATQSPGAAA